MPSATAGLRRRDFIGTGLMTAGALGFGPSFWRQALAAAPTTLGEGPYGPLQPADANGLQLPKGFTSRIVARANQPVGLTTYRWPVFPDGKASFAAPDGGYIIVVNSESRPPDAGSSAIRFSKDGAIVDAYRILGNTSGNCAGGPTPWGTWLSCEEIADGLVWECDPSKAGQGVARPALGSFNHEAAAVDPTGKRVYLTEDRGDGGFYRFTPASYPDLAMGRLEVALVDGAGKVSWAEVPDPTAATVETRKQVAGMRTFGGGEGIWFDTGIVYFATKSEDRVYAYDTIAERLEVIYDKKAFGAEPGPLSGLDNITVSPSGDLFVCEDGGDLDIGLITPQREVSRFVKVTGPGQAQTEIAGVIFDPSGTRMYFSSQRADAFGITYEVTGPFRTERAPGTGGPGGVGGGGTLTSPGAGQPGTSGTDDGDARPPSQGGSQSGENAQGGGGGGGAPAAAPPGAAAPPAGGGGGTSGEDVNAPGLRIRAPRRVSLKTLRDEGLPVTIELSEASSVSVAVRTNELRRTAGARGSVDRPLPTKIGGARRPSVRKGRTALRVRVGPKTASRLRRTGKGSVRARITVGARDERGRLRIATRLLRIRIR